MAVNDRGWLASRSLAIAEGSAAAEIDAQAALSAPPAFWEPVDRRPKPLRRTRRATSRLVRLTIRERCTSSRTWAGGWSSTGNRRAPGRPNSCEPVPDGGRDIHRAVDRGGGLISPTRRVGINPECRACEKIVVYKLLSPTGLSRPWILVDLPGGCIGGTSPVSADCGVTSRAREPASCIDRRIACAGSAP